ncbi:hypothetical protein QJ857_gp0409 [Tupanvirus soda lake]|uniref:Uncharacterized protein n=2 Tax=Tupanvirus TaxID=2094720 RepID=A0A6N1NMQ3_9VIRU|nr:hypothetical protein QJ857_gp0409 [Tupanvirus soda lake]QKU35625.1 hypothetical protein [Tupanvirus soda lake]
MADDKTYIIDPLTSLCKVALLHFMPGKTKLAISHHVLYVQGYSYYQWLERMKNGDSRIDISNLNTPFLKAIKWYILDDCPEKAAMDKELTNSIRTITHFTILGLSKLQNCTYNNDPAIKIILQYFINLLRDALDNIWSEDKCVKMDNNNNILSDKIKNNYEAHTINSIAKMLSDADKIKNSQEDVMALIDCAHQLLINRDTTFVKLMKEVNTTL